VIDLAAAEGWRHGETVVVNRNPADRLIFVDHLWIVSFASAAVSF
jgi:hypothetical protein